MKSDTAIERSTKTNLSPGSSGCAGCDRRLESEWVACPYCGRPVSGKADTEKIVRLATKVGVDLLEAGLIQAEAGAEERGDKSRAAQIAIARNLAKDVAPKIADAVTTYIYQRQTLGTASHPRAAGGRGRG